MVCPTTQAEMEMSFKREKRQQIINEYLNATGRNFFVPSEFLEWLQGKPEHQCHKLFFGMDDATAARAHREDMVRSWVSGLRFTVVRDVPADAKTVEVRSFKLPAMVSPQSGRKGGGGYTPTDADDGEHIAEIVRQGSHALASWLERYEGAIELSGVDVSPVRALLGSIQLIFVEPE